MGTGVQRGAAATGVASATLVIWISLFWPRAAVAYEQTVDLRLGWNAIHLHMYLTQVSHL